MNIKETVITYPSYDKASQIYALFWDAEDVQPQGIVQIVHGAAEHCERYRDFAHFLVGEGYFVCANDHIGHGKSIGDIAMLGHMPVKNGKEVLLADIDALRKYISIRYPDVPYFMFGHSMGSFILRVYLSKHAKGLAGVILSGTGQQPKALSFLGGVMARILAKTKGEQYQSALLHSIGMGALSKSIPHARTPFDWISTDQAVVDAYVADERCGEVFTVGGYATLTGLTGEMVTAACAKAVPDDLPLLFLSGKEDPVGEKGKAVKAAISQYCKAGQKHVGLQLYDGLRHEVLNEPIRECVYRDIVDWLEATA